MRIGSVEKSVLRVIQFITGVDFFEPGADRSRFYYTAEKKYFISLISGEDLESQTAARVKGFVLPYRIDRQFQPADNDLYRIKRTEEPVDFIDDLLICESVFIVI